MGTNNLVALLLGISAICVVSWFAMQLAKEWLRIKTENHKASFLTDINRIQIKWAKRGFAEYAALCATITDSLFEYEEKPLTEYGRQVKKELQEINSK